MKNKFREKAVNMSNTALALTLAATTCFVGCKDKTVETEKGTAKVINDKEYVEVNEKNMYSFDKVQLGGDKSNSGEEGTKTTNKAEIKPAKLFKPLYSEEQLKETKSMLSEHVIVDFGKNRIYKDVDGNLVLIDKTQAVKLIESTDGKLKIDKAPEECTVGKYVLTNEFGQRTLVFEDTESVQEFAEAIATGYEQLEADQKGAIINGVSFAPLTSPITVACVDKDQQFVEFQQIMDALSEHIQSLGLNEGAITYEIKDGYAEVTREKYINDNGVISTEKLIITLPFGDKGATYYDPDFDVIVPYTYEENDIIYISITTLSMLLGIDVSEGAYTIPSTETTLEDVLYISTYEDSNYSTAVDKNFVVLPKDEIPESSEEVYLDYSFILDDSTDIYIEEEWAQEVQDVISPPAGAIDDKASEQLGIEVPLFQGTPEEKAQQLAAYLTDYYSYMGLVFIAGGSSLTCDNWPEMDFETPWNEHLAKAEEILGPNIDFDNLSIEDAYKIAPWLAGANQEAGHRIDDMLTYSYWEGTGSGGGKIYW